MEQQGKPTPQMEFNPEIPNQIVINIPPLKSIKKKSDKLCSKCKLSIKANRNIMKSASTQTEVNSNHPTVTALPPSPSPTQLPNKFINPSMMLNSPSNVLLLSFLKNFRTGLLYDENFLPICICIPNIFIQFDLMPTTSIKWVFERKLWESNLFSHTDKYVVTNFKTDFSYVEMNDDLSKINETIYQVCLFVISTEYFHSKKTSISKFTQHFFIVINNNEKPTLINANILQCKPENFTNVFCWLSHYLRSQTIVNHMKPTTLATLFDIMFKPNSEISSKEVQSNNPSHVIAIYKPVMNDLVKMLYGSQKINKFFAPTNMLFQYQHSNPELMQEGFFRALSLSTLNEYPHNDKFLLKSKHLRPWNPSNSRAFKLNDFLFVEQQFLHPVDEGHNFLVNEISVQTDVEIEMETENYNFCSSIENFYNDNKIFYIFPPIQEENQ